MYRLRNPGGTIPGPAAPASWRRVPRPSRAPGDLPSSRCTSSLPSACERHAERTAGRRPSPATSRVRASTRRFTWSASRDRERRRRPGCTPRASTYGSSEYISSPTGSGAPICSKLGGVEEREPECRARRRASVVPSGLTATTRRYEPSVPCMIPSTAGDAPEGGEQVPPGLRRVGDRHGLPRQEQRAIEVLLDEGLRAEALGELRLAPTASAWLAASRASPRCPRA